MRKFRIKSFTVTVIITISMMFAAWSIWHEHRLQNAYTSGLKTEVVRIESKSGKKHSFNLEVAASPIDIEVGLMHRYTMPADHGMIFLMGKTPKETSFWMKNTKIPLDMLFVGPTGEIVNIHHSATPDSLSPIPSGGAVTAVIELNGGIARELNLAPGDKVIYSYFE